MRTIQALYSFRVAVIRLQLVERCSHALPCHKVESAVVETDDKIIESIDELPERVHPFSISKTSVGVELGRQSGRSRCDEKASSESVFSMHLHS